MITTGLTVTHQLEIRQRVICKTSEAGLESLNSLVHTGLDLKEMSVNESSAGRKEGPVEGVSVHRSLGVLQFPQVEETLSEPRVRPVQTGAPDGLTEKTNATTVFRNNSNNWHCRLQSQQSFFYLFTLLLIQRNDCCNI